MIFLSISNQSNFLSILRAIESKWQKLWKERQAFIPKIDPTRPKWFVTIPFPYTSGPLHIGHCRTYNLGDIHTRAKRHQGYNVLWPMAWHITGTPVLSIATRIKNQDPKIWQMYREYVGIYESDPNQIEVIVDSFEDPQRIAMYFADKLMIDFHRMGFSIDSTRQFTSADPEFNRFIEWQYGILAKKGYITRGQYPILWCSQCDNAVGEDDILAGDEAKVEVSTYYGVKFPLDSSEEETFLVAATLRPETIFGATNIWINPTGQYVSAQICHNSSQEVWIVSRSALKKLKAQAYSVTIQEEFGGDQIIGKHVRVPLTDRIIPVLPASFMDAEHASGVVYSVPAHAPFDFIALQDLQNNLDQMKAFSLDPVQIKKISPISLITVEGYGDFPAVEVCQNFGISSQEEGEKLDQATQIIYKAEFYSGKMKAFTGEFAHKSVAAAKDIAQQIFVARNIAAVIHEPSHKAFCRCGQKVSVAVIADQYFLNYGDPTWKTSAWDALKHIKIYPEKYRESFNRTFAWLDKRPCVRKRGLGTEFPMTKGKGWIIESLSDSVIYMAFYLIIAQIRSHEISAAALIPEVFDFIFRNQGKVADVSQKSGITVSVLHEMRASFEYWYPNDFRHTAINHISNHLSFAIFHHVAVFSKGHGLKIISLNDLLIREGQKMGKSKGNVIPIATIPSRYSVDLTRLHLASVATVDSVIDWREKEIGHSLKQIKKFWDLAQRYLVTAPKKGVFPSKMSFYSKTFLASVRQNYHEALTLLNVYQIRTYIQRGFSDVLRKIEKYQRIATSLELSETYEIIRRVLKWMVIVIAPVMPHICEELFHASEPAGKSEFVSFQPFPTFHESAEDMILAQQAKYIDQLAADISQIIQLNNISPTAIYIYIAPDWKQTLYDVIDEVSQGKSVVISEIMKHAKMIPVLSSHMKEVAGEAKIIVKNPSLVKFQRLSPDKEKEAINGFRAYLGNLFNQASVTIFDGSGEDVYDPAWKAGKSRPMKPSLYLE